MKCRDIEIKIGRILDGRDTLGDARIVDVHLEGCAKCRTYALLLDRAHRIFSRFEPADMSQSLSERAFTKAIIAAQAVRASLFDEILPFARKAVVLAAGFTFVLGLRAWVLQMPTPASVRSDPLEQLSQPVLTEVDAALTNTYAADSEDR